MNPSVPLTVLARYLLVILFFPFSALDKILNFRGAVKQAQELLPAERPAEGLIMAGVAIETLMPLAILTGKSDRLAASILAGYCGATAILFKQFWRKDDFWVEGKSESRDLFWDFLKNFSVAGGCLLITFGTTGSGVEEFLADPLASSRPYRARTGRRRRR